MKFRNIICILGCTAFLLTACNTNRGESTGRSTPIDSTNTNGTAPATYGGDNPANDQDTVLPNSNDTGTKLSHGPNNSVNTSGNNTPGNNNSGSNTTSGSASGNQ